MPNFSDKELKEHNRKLRQENFKLNEESSRRLSLLEDIYIADRHKEKVMENLKKYLEEMGAIDGG